MEGDSKYNLSPFIYVGGCLGVPLFHMEEEFLCVGISSYCTGGEKMLMMAVVTCIQPEYLLGNVTV